MHVREAVAAVALHPDAHVGLVVEVGRTRHVVQRRRLPVVAHVDGLARVRHQHRADIVTAGELHHLLYHLAHLVGVAHAVFARLGEVVEGVEYQEFHVHLHHRLVRRVEHVPHRAALGVERREVAVAPALGVLVQPLRDFVEGVAREHLEELLVEVGGGVFLGRPHRHPPAVSDGQLHRHVQGVGAFARARFAAEQHHAPFLEAQVAVGVEHPRAVRLRFAVRAPVVGLRLIVGGGPEHVAVAHLRVGQAPFHGPASRHRLAFGVHPLGGEQAFVGVLGGEVALAVVGVEVVPFHYPASALPEVFRQPLAQFQSRLVAVAGYIDGLQVVVVRHAVGSEHLFHVGACAVGHADDVLMAQAAEHHGILRPFGDDDFGIADAGVLVERDDGAALREGEILDGDAAVLHVHYSGARAVCVGQAGLGLAGAPEAVFGLVHQSVEGGQVGDAAPPEILHGGRGVHGLQPARLQALRHRGGGIPLEALVGPQSGAEYHPHHVALRVAAVLHAVEAGADARALEDGERGVVAVGAGAAAEGAGAAQHAAARFAVQHFQFTVVDDDVPGVVPFRYE